MCTRQSAKTRREDDEVVVVVDVVVDVVDVVLQVMLCAAKLLGHTVHTRRDSGVGALDSYSPTTHAGNWGRQNLPPVRGSSSSRIRNDEL